MPAKDLGTKHTCWKCSARFYDLRKATPVCPKCGADPRQSPALKSPAAERRARAAPRPEPVDDPVVAEDGAADKDLEEELDDEELEAAAEDEEEP